MGSPFKHRTARRERKAFHFKSKFEVGTEITCPNCSAVMLRCKEVPAIGDVNFEDKFDRVEFLNPGRWEPKCPHCDTEWGAAGRGFHTKDGWIR